MSFQDVGKPGAPKRSNQRSQLTTVTEAASNTSSNGFAQVSDGILQYQRNVGILEKIVRQIGTKTDGPLLETQYKAQVDVLRQLGNKLEAQLRTQEDQIASLPRTEAAKRRATHVKLSRDFRRVEATFKNLQLDTRRKRARLLEQQAQNEQSRPSPPETDEAKMQLEMQMQQDRLNEEMMREREEEIRNINKGMHQVNEIYKDLAQIVGDQQEDVDQIETQMEDTRTSAEAGMKHIQKANDSSSQCTIS